MNTKLHAIADANGRPLSFFMTAGRPPQGLAPGRHALRPLPTAFFSAIALAVTVIF